MTEDMTGKIVVIAGGSPEVAEATARLLATRGAAGLMVAGRGAERGQALAAIVSAAGCPTHFLPVDLARAQDCAAVITEAELVFGRIDALIVTIGGTGGQGPRTLAAAAGRGALGAMARGFAESLAVNRIRVFGILLDDERAGVAAPPTQIARVIAELTAGSAPTASGSIIELAQARTSGAVTA